MMLLEAVVARVVLEDLKLCLNSKKKTKKQKQNRSTLRKTKKRKALENIIGPSPILQLSINLHLVSQAHYVP